MKLFFFSAIKLSQSLRFHSDCLFSSFFLLLSATGLLRRTLYCSSKNLNKIKKTSIWVGWQQGIPVLLCFRFFFVVFFKSTFFSTKRIQKGGGGVRGGGMLKFVREESWHPWSWHSVFWCGVSRTKVAISCSVSMHVPSRSRLKTV